MSLKYLRPILLLCCLPWLAVAAPSFDDILRPEEAFRYTVDATASEITVRWTIEPGHYMYKKRMGYRSLTPGVELGDAVLPTGKIYDDEFFGPMEIYRGAAVVTIPVLSIAPDVVDVELEIRSQGCADIGLCYPPQKWTALAIFTESGGQFKPPPDNASATNTGADEPTRRVRTADAQQMVSEQDRLSHMILSGNFALVLATFLGLGLLLAFTPCVLPMVPILSGIIAGQGKDVTTGRAFALSLTYVLGMALTYTIAGAAVAAAGGQIQAALQKPWIIISVAGLFIVMALSMFGAFELQMPAAIQNRLTGIGNRQRTGTFIGTAILGALSALVVSTCVAPPLVATLTVIAQAGDIARGAAALFAMSIGMGIPLLVIGTSAGRLLPKVGAWMNQVKGAFGFMMLGLAIWMLERILPAPVTVALWGALVFVAATFLGAFTALTSEATTGRKLAKSFGLIAALYGAVLLFGALGGANDPLRPLQFSGLSGGSAKHLELQFQRVKTVTDLERAVTEATAVGRPVMLDFYADWCVSCKEMERYTFSDQRVHDALNGVLLLQADVTANDEEDQALLQRFGIFGPPTIVFFDANGDERRQYSVVGFMPAADFATHVTDALRGS